MIKQTAVENGKLRGISAADPRIISYKGIPYAAPPVGKLRWCAPQPAENWDGVLDCSRFGPISMQAPPGLDTTNLYAREWNVDPEIEMSEDCLTLNIWTPAKTTEERLPVFVWFFGGGLVEGNTAEMEFNGERIARRGIVVVTVNYRLNVFGFLAHPELTKEHPDFPTNFGSLDQMFSLQWVKRNITAFGGDPENVTIGGQSAGGRSVQVQLSSPLTEGLFNKAIIMSGIRVSAYGGSGNHGANRTLEQAEADGKEFFEYAGFKSLEQAREVDAKTLVSLFCNYAGIGSGLGPSRKMWAPVIDGSFQTDHFSSVIAQGRCHNVPLMMSNTATESWEQPNVSSMEELEKVAKESFGDDAQKFLDTVRGETLEETIQNARFCPMELGMRLYFDGALKRSPAPKCWGAQFAPDIPGWDNAGTFHSSDLWFVFESLASCWRPFNGKHYDLARQMCNYVSNFIKCGDPNGPDNDGTPMPQWKPYSECKGQMIYSEKGSAQAGDEQVTPVMKFLTGFYEK